MARLRYLLGLVIAFAFIATGALGADQTFTGSVDRVADEWNDNVNWTGATPSGSDNAFIPSNYIVDCNNNSTPAYTGDLTISNGATLMVGYMGGLTGSSNSMGTAGQSVIYAEADTTIHYRAGGSPIIPEIQLSGNFTYIMGSSTQPSSDPSFNHPITGSYKFTLKGKGGCDAVFSNNNTFTEFVVDNQYGDSMTVTANAPGALGAGDITIVADSDNIRCAKLTINATNAMADAAIVTINGVDSTDRITMNTNDTIAELFLDEVRQDAGTYGRIGNASVDYEVVWLLGDGILTVTGPSLSYWDTNSTTAGAGGATPSATWDAANTYWGNADGTAATAAWTPGDLAAFAAGTDASGAYTVTVSSVQDISGLYFEEGSVTIEGDALEMTAQSYFNVAEDLTATLSSVVTNDATAWKFIKSGDGTLVPTAANTYGGITRIEGGTMVVSNLQDAGSPSHIGSYPTSDEYGLVLAGGGTLRYTGGSTNVSRGLNLQGDGTIDIANDDTRLVLSTSLSSQVQGTLTVTGGSGSSFAMDQLRLYQGVGLTLKPIGISMTVTSVYGNTEYPYPTTPLVLSGTSTGNVIEGTITHWAPGSWPRPVSVQKRGSSTWTLAGAVSESTYTYEGTLILAATNIANLAHYLYSGTLIFAENRALGTWMNDFYIGVENGGADATFLISGAKAFEEHRSIRVVADDTEDTGGRTITIGGCTADESYFRDYILLSTDFDHDVAYGISLTASNGGVVTFEGTIMEPTNTVSSAYTIKKIGEGTVVFASTNNYSGATSVEEGILTLATDGTLDDASALYITNTAKVAIGDGVDETVGELYLGGQQSFHGYTYGSSDSAADFKLDDWFAGTGVVTVAGARDGLCSITNAAASDVLGDGATFNGILQVTNISTDVYVHWGPTDGTNDYDAWTNMSYVGTWTSVFWESISFTTNGMSGDTTYYYTFRASNSVANIWATPSTNFTTLTSVQVNNSTGATSETDVSATLRGTLVNGSVADAWICWGDNDGGNSDTGDWDYVVSMGTVAEGVEFTTLAEGLTPNATYWYRCFATNAVGQDWSDTPQSFSGVPINPGNGGSVAIYTHNVLEEGVLNPEGQDDYDLTWNTIVRQSADYELDYSGRVNVTADPGYHLVMHSARYSTGRNGDGRVEGHQYILVDGEAPAIGWASGYADNWQDRQDLLISGGGIIYLAATGTVSIQAHRTDSETDDDDVDRIADCSGFQLLKLDSTWDYCRLSKSTAQVGPVSATYVDVEYDTQDELDTDSFTHTNGTAEIILKTAGHYLVFVNTYIFEDGDTLQIRHRLTLNGAAVEGSLTGQIIGNSSDADEGAATLGIIIETSGANEVLNVEVAVDDNSVVPTFIMPDKTAITIAKLPDDGDYIRLHNDNVNTITNFNAEYDLAMDWDTEDELDAGGFTGSYSATNSVITATADADYLFLATLYDNSCGTVTYMQRWSTNGVSDPLSYAVGGDTTQGGEGGSYSGLIVGLQSNSTVEVLSGSVSYSGSPSVLNGQSAGLWGMRLASVLPPGDIANTVPTDIDGSSATLHGILRAAYTNYTVYVHFGDNDGGTNFVWDAYYEVGDYGPVSSTNLSYLKGALSVGGTYYYTFRGSNDAGNIWAAPSWSFVTTEPLGSGNLFILF